MKNKRKPLPKKNKGEIVRVTFSHPKQGIHTVYVKDGGLPIEVNNN